MNKTNLVTCVLILSTALTVSAQQRSRGQARQNTQTPRVPKGVRAQRNIAYVVNGHKRHVLDLFVPDKADGPLPLIIWIHGGGWQNGSKERCLPLRKGYTERGYAVASINYRLSGHATFPAQIEDCKAAVRWLRAHAKEYNIDPDRFGVWGSSAGGHLVSLVGTSGDVKEFDVGGNLEQSSRVQAVCDYYGPTDFKVFVTTPGYEKHGGVNSPEAKLIGGAVLENKGKASRLNPITYVTKDDPPFLIVHGDKDRTVPINQSQLLFESLKVVGVSGHFHTIHGAGHGKPGFDAPEIETMVLAFFERHLKSKSPPLGSPDASTSESTATEGPSRNAQVADGKVSEDWVDLYKPHADDEMPYRLMKPMGFDSNKRYPVIVSLHGGAGRGTDNRKQLRGWNKLLAEEQRRSDYPCYVLAPQANRLWDAAHLKNIKDVVAALPSVDMDRIYILGHSMGGHGTYILIQIDPVYFAAAAPSAGTGLPRTEEFIDASLIKDVPIWSFHGDNDKVCPIERDQKLFAEMEKLGGNMKLTTWAGDGHGVAEKMITGGDNGSTQLSSDRCDGEPEFLKWLFSHNRSPLQNSKQQERPRKQNKGAGVPQEILDAYEARVFDGMPYRLLLPANFEAAKKYPLILNLHGGAGVGDDNESNLRNWSAKFVDAAWRAKYPCIVVAPQAAADWSVTGEIVPELTESLKKTYSEAWQARLEKRNYPPGPKSNGPLTKAFALIDHLAEEFAVDTNRVYVLGHSMGGAGSWNTVWAAPERFAAAIPSAGGLLPWKDPAKLKYVPIWAFHGGSDPVVPTDFTREIFARIKKVGGNLKYTELKGVAHNASRYAFSYEGDEPEKGYVTQYSSERCDKTANVWDWLFAQRLDKR